MPIPGALAQTLKSVLQLLELKPLPQAGWSVFCMQLPERLFKIPIIVAPHPNLAQPFGWTLGAFWVYPDSLRCI